MQLLYEFPGGNQVDSLPPAQSCCGSKCYAGTEAANAKVVVMLASGQRVVGWDKPSELWTKATAFGAPNQMQ